MSSPSRHCQFGESLRSGLVSGNYRYKLGRGVLRKIGESAYKHNFLEMSLKPRPTA